MRLALFSLLSLIFVSCGSTPDSENRKVVGPPDTKNNKPWPLANEGGLGSPLGPAFERR